MSDFFEEKTRIGAQIVTEFMHDHDKTETERTLKFINDCRDILGQRHLTEGEYNELKAA